MSDAPQPTKEAILGALSGVHVPELQGDVVSRQVVRHVAVCDGVASIELALPPAVAPVRDRIERLCRNAVLGLPGIRQVNLRVAGASPAEGESLVPGVRHIIAVASGKGGVGKSTVAVNLAVALAKDGARVGLLDADIYGPSIPVMLGIQRQPFHEGGKILPIEAHGIVAMSLGFLMPDTGTPVIWRGPMVGGAVRQMLADVAWGDLDYLIVDLPPGTGDAQLTLAQVVPLTGVVIVLTSQDVAVNIASKALAMFRRLNVPVLGVVENMSTFVCPHCGETTNIFTRGGGQAAAQALGVPFLGSIPLDPSIVEHGDRGTPTVIAAPGTPQAEAFRAVAAQVAERVNTSATERPNPLGALLGRFRKE